MLDLPRTTSFLLLLAVLASCGGGSLPQRGAIVLRPIGPVPYELLAHLQRELPPILGRDVVIAAAISRPAGALDTGRGQYRGSALLEDLKAHDIAAGERVVGIIDADAYAPGLNFIFGQAMKPGRFAVVALPRLRESFRGRPDDDARFRDRVVKETVHELGHTFDLPHCDDRTCVMHFSNSFADTDRKGARFCTRERIPR